VRAVADWTGWRTPRAILTGWPDPPGLPAAGTSGVGPGSSVPSPFASRWARWWGQNRSGPTRHQGRAAGSSGPCSRSSLAP